MVAHRRALAAEPVGRFGDDLLGPGVPAQHLLGVDGSNRSRRDAAEALLAIGPPAEDAVLAKLAVTTDTFAKAQLVDILGEIGTPKSLPALRALAAEKRGLAQNAAKKAVEAIEGR